MFTCIEAVATVAEATPLGVWVALAAVLAVIPVVWWSTRAGAQNVQAYAAEWEASPPAGEEDEADATGNDPEFEALVEEALASLPEEFRTKMKNLTFLVEDEPPEGSRYLAVYQGVPLTRRRDNVDWSEKITIFRGPLRRQSEGDPEQLRRWVTHMVWHEVAHHFGISDERLVAIGGYYPKGFPQPESVPPASS